MKPEPIIAEPSLCRAELDRFAGYFYRQTGIVLARERYPAVRRRLRQAIDACGGGGFEPFFRRVADDLTGPEMQAAINALTVNETSFWREAYQFEALLAGVLPELAASVGGRALKLWSVPCSTGEEPYSIALHLLENRSGAGCMPVKIMASDIDTRALGVARAGHFGARAVARLPRPMLERYFEPAGSGRFRLARAVRDTVSFTPCNILDTAGHQTFRNCDVIFCRNLLIYFDEASRRQALRNIHDCLRPGGYVFLGHSESMSRMSSLFEPRRHCGQTVYRRPGA